MIQAWADYAPSALVAHSLKVLQEIETTWPGLEIDQTHKR